VTRDLFSIRGKDVGKVRPRYLAVLENICRQGLLSIFDNDPIALQLEPDSISCKSLAGAAPVV